MKRYLPYVIVVTVGLMTIAGGLILYRMHRPTLITASKREGAIGENKVTHIRGPADAPVTIEEFGDFQCPPCGTLSRPLRQLEEKHKTSLRMIFRHFPFPIHQHAFAAACAAEAADLQGKFWEMHDLLYKEQSDWSKASDVRQMFISYAGALGLDVNRFSRDIDSNEVKVRVDQDQKLGTTLGVNSTPTLFMNNEMVPPASLNPEILQKLVDETVAKTAKPASN